MKLRRLYMVELEDGQNHAERKLNADFLSNIQAAVLCALRSGNKLSGWQFEQCAAKLKDSSHKPKNA